MALIVLATVLGYGAATYTERLRAAEARITTLETVRIQAVAPEPTPTGRRLYPIGFKGPFYELVRPLD